MATEMLTVLLEGQPIGELERRSGGDLWLRFDPAYTTDAGATPLSVSMPATEALHGDAQVTPWLWGLLPDNGDVLARWGRAFGVSVGSPFALLGTQVGHDCAGAVQFCLPEAVDELRSRPGEVDWLSDEEIATRLRSLRADSATWLGPGFTGQFSLGGAQAKTALHRAEGRWGVSRGSTPTTHILKPAVAGFQAQDLNEHICMAAARRLGLQVAATRLERFEDESAIVVERYDRIEHGGHLLRIHQEDLCQALSVPPTRKYQSEGGPTPGRIAALLRSTIAGPEAETDVWRFVDALAYNWLIAGTDAHAKNYSLLLAGGQIRLAPLYDLASFLPYDESAGHRVKLAMKVGDDYRLAGTDRTSAWERTADNLGLNRDRVLRRVHDLAVRAPAAFATVLGHLDEPALDTDLPRRLVDLVTERCRRCAALLA